MSIPLLTILGRMTLAFLEAIGSVSAFAFHAIRQAVQPPWYRQQILRQIMEIGYYSLPVVGLTAIFTGMVLALQSYTGFARFSAESAIPNVVVVSLTRELGPVLAGLMVAGRVGAAMAAEIGTMRVTEQIDALTTLSTDPFKYLVVPRLIAGIVTLPILVLIADIIGILGGFLVGGAVAAGAAHRHLVGTLAGQARQCGRDVAGFAHAAIVAALGLRCFSVFSEIGL